MSSKPILYATHRSPASRAAHMTLEALGMDYEFKVMDISAGDTRTPEFLKMNPQHTVPTLKDIDGKCIWDSHAIMAYLVRKYGKDDSLYPKDFYARAVVDQRLHYETGNIFTGLVVHKLAPIMRGKVKKAQLPEIMNSISEVYKMLETFLNNQKFMAGNKLTIADLSIVSTVSGIVAFQAIDMEKYPNLGTWYEHMKMLPYYEKVNGEVKQQHKRVEAKLSEMA